MTIMTIRTIAILLKDHAKNKPLFPYENIEFMLIITS